MKKSTKKLLFERMNRIAGMPLNEKYATGNLYGYGDDKKGVVDYLAQRRITQGIGLKGNYENYDGTFYIIPDPRLVVSVFITFNSRHALNVDEVNGHLKITVEGYTSVGDINKKVINNDFTLHLEYSVKLNKVDGGYILNLVGNDIDIKPINRKDANRLAEMIKTVTTGKVKSDSGEINVVESNVHPNSLITSYYNG